MTVSINLPCSIYRWRQGICFWILWRQPELFYGQMQRAFWSLKRSGFWFTLQKLKMIFSIAFKAFWGLGQNSPGLTILKPTDVAGGSMQPLKDSENPLEEAGSQRRVQVGPHLAQCGSGGPMLGQNYRYRIRGYVNSTCYWISLLPLSSVRLVVQFSVFRNMQRVG